MFNSSWFENLIQPPLTPPSWVFTPVWACIYITILAAFLLYFISKTENKGIGYFYFFLQIFLNIIWSPIFFGLQNITLALFIIILLDITVFFTIRKFYSVSKFAGLTLIPYFIWILFATYLNIGYFILN